MIMAADKDDEENGRARHDDKPLNLFLSIINVVGFIITLYQFLYWLQVSKGPKSTQAAGSDLLTAVLVIGLLAYIVHGALWRLIERRFEWKFGAGGGDAMPEGYQAVILSITLVLPLAILPLLYQLFTSEQIVHGKHYFAS